MQYFVIINFILLFSFSLQAQNRVKWMTFEDAVQAQQVEKKKIFVDMYTDWCGWCKRMDATTFKDSAVIATLNSQYYPVKFNAERDDVISYKGEKYKLIRRGKKKYHELAAEFIRKSSNPTLSYPTFIFIDEDLNVIQPIKGYKKVSQFLPILDYFAYDNHKKLSWSEFQRGYRGH